MEKKPNEYVNFVVTARRYKTLLTTKFKDRPIWHKPSSGEVLSTLPGTIIQVKVKKGQKVKEGQLLVIHEAMKMYNRIVAPIEGTVVDVNVAVGDKIGKNFVMINIES